MQSFEDIGVERDGLVAVVEIRRPPDNYFDVSLIRQIAEAFEALDGDASCRAIVLAAKGRAFCAGAQLNPEVRKASAPVDNRLSMQHLYIEGLRLFATRKPIVGAIHGAAIGGGLGLALVADFRVTCPEARFSANFTKLGFHPGFGLTATLPQLIGYNKACLLLYTSRRLKGDEAHALGLADVLVASDQVRPAALTLAREVAENSPLGVMATRATMRLGMVERVRAATERELLEQTRLRETNDFREGVRAYAERRPANFTGS